MTRKSHPLHPHTTMTERPILFSAPMVRAILAGTKTQTRRVLKGVQPWGVRDGKPEWAIADSAPTCPYGKPGDRLWVRETWYCDDYRVQRGPYLKPADMELDEARSDGTLIYRASCGDRPYEAEQPVWRPAIHMPRWASRLTLEITGVRAERLQAISQEDARAEGVHRNVDGLWSGGAWKHIAQPNRYSDPCNAFCDLWASINGGESWDANPWVWVVEFKRAA